MANILATGHGLIGGWLARQEKEDKEKRRQDALAGYLGGDPAGVEVAPAGKPSITQAFPANTAKPAFPSWQQAALDGTMPTKGGLMDYAENYGRTSADPVSPDPVADKINGSFRAMTGGQPQPAQGQPAQPARSIIPERTSSISADTMNRDVAMLIKKGIPAEAAMAVVNHVHGQRKAAEQEAQASKYVPQLRGALTEAIRSSDRASALGAILQLQQYGVKVPQELITWADPNKQRLTNDIGDKEINSSFDQRTGKYSNGQVFDKGQSPDAAASNALNWAKFGYQRDRDALGDQGKTWQARRGNKDSDDIDEVDPVKLATNLREYKNFTNELLAKKDGSKTAQEVADALKNKNNKQEWKARVTAAHGSKAQAQYKNDVEAVADAYGLVYENGAWRVR